MQVGLVEKSYLSSVFFCFKESFIMYILAPLFSAVVGAVVRPRALALNPFFWGHQFGDPGLVSISKLTNL